MNNQPRCSCGRIAEVDVDGKWLCFEAWIPEDRIRWQEKYKKELKEPRHERKENV